MGSFSEWSYTAFCTVWEPTYDEYSHPVSWARTVYPCSYKVGSRLPVSDRNEQFYPSTVVWLSSMEPPKLGSVLVIGDSPALVPPSYAETIRVVRTHDPSLFSQGVPDHEVYTQ